MVELNITDIDLNMSVQDFEREFQDCIHNYPASMNYSIKPMSTKRGKNMYKLTVDNGDDSNIEIVGERDDTTGNIHFHPLKLQNMNNSFYSVYYGDTDIISCNEDPAVFMAYAFDILCKNHKGSFAYIETNGHMSIIKDGSNRKVSSVALIDEDGNVYSCAGAKNIKGASDDVDFNVKKPIAEWLQENPEVQREIAKLPQLDAKMNFIGKYLINAKIKEEIDSDEFIDIFCQAGIIGFSEPSVLNIYKLVM